MRSSSWVVESYKIEQDLGEKTMHEPRLEHGKNEVEHSLMWEEAGHPVVPTSTGEGSSRQKMVQSKIRSQITNFLLVGSKIAPLGNPRVSGVHRESQLTRGDPG